MSIKFKVASGIIVLVILILTQGIICNIFLYKFSDASSQILKDNYASIEYCKEMTKAIDKIQNSIIVFENQKLDSSDKHVLNFYKDKEMFLKNLKAEEMNITEPGEKSAEEFLHSGYDNYIKLLDGVNFKSTSINSQIPLIQITNYYSQIKNDIVTIWDLNMNAIARKNEIAKDASHQAIWYVSIIEMIALVILLPLLFLFPGYIANQFELKKKERII